MSGYYGYDNSLSSQLQHHGVKGMHWGVRKHRGNTPSSSSSADDHRKRLGAAEDAHGAIVAKHQARYRSQGMGRREAYAKALEHPEAKRAEAHMNKIEAEGKTAKAKKATDPRDDMVKKYGDLEDKHGAIIKKHYDRHRANGLSRRAAYRKATEHPEAKAVEHQLDALDKKIRNR